MTEEEWWACRGYDSVLDFVVGHVSDRKLRLLPCGCCRRPELWRLTGVAPGPRAPVGVFGFCERATADALQVLSPWVLDPEFFEDPVEPPDLLAGDFQVLGERGLQIRRGGRLGHPGQRLEE